MPARSPCPDAPALRELLLGRLLPEDGDPLYEHLEECDRCEEYARAFRPNDWLNDAIRTIVGGDGCENPSVLALIEALRRMGPPRPDSNGANESPSPEDDNDHHGTILSYTIPPPGEAIETRRELFDFLAPALEPDELGRLGQYRILKVLGSGGMGVVFHADDPALQRPVALKAMLPALAVSASARRRFLREGRAVAALHHDHIVPIYQVGEDRGVPYIAMPLLHGESLDNRLERLGTLPTAEVYRIGREIAQGLAAAHAKGLVHRDIKPANVWLEFGGDAVPEPGSGRVKILDFGLVRPVADAHLTQEGAIVGTPAFMAPEQASGAAVDARTDLFSLGCVLYRMTTGQVPFAGRDAVATLLAVDSEHPPAPVEITPAVPPALSALVMRLLAKNPADRPASAREVIELLTKGGGERRCSAASESQAEMAAMGGARLHGVRWRRRRCGNGLPGFRADQARRRCHRHGRPGRGGRRQRRPYNTHCRSENEKILPTRPYRLDAFPCRRSRRATRVA
jgi:eukaryotic-like serine/threonine-protein kinase